MATFDQTINMLFIIAIVLCLILSAIYVYVLVQRTSGNFGDYHRVLCQVPRTALDCADCAALIAPDGLVA
jgi:hypothetical protein